MMGVFRAHRMKAMQSGMVLVLILGLLMGCRVWGLGNPDRWLEVSDTTGIGKTLNDQYYFGGVFYVGNGDYLVPAWSGAPGAVAGDSSWVMISAGTIFVPMIVGGTGTTSGLILQTTSGVGATDTIHLRVGNNGDVEAITIPNSGNVGIGTLNPTEALDINGNLTFTGIRTIYGTNLVIHGLRGEFGSVISRGSDVVVLRTRADIGSVQIGGSTNKNIFEVFPLSEYSIFEGRVGIGTGSPSAIFDVEKTGTVKINNDFVEITNSGNAVDMDGTTTGILFNQWYYDGATPAVANSGRIGVSILNDWTSTASTQDSYIQFDPVLDGSLIDMIRMYGYGYVTHKTDSSAEYRMVTYNSGIIQQSQISLDKYEGTGASPSAAVDNGELVGRIRGRVYDGGNTRSIAHMEFKVDAPGGASDTPGRIGFYTTPDGAFVPLERMRIKNDGKVGIGTTTPNELLDVAGNVVIGKGSKCDGYFVRAASEVSTDDAVQTGLDSLVLLDENTYHMKCFVIGVEDDGSNRASYEVVGTFYRTGAGNAAQQGTTTVLHSEESDVTWGLDYVVNGSKVVVKVTGVAATTIEWSCIMRYSNMSN